MNLEITNKLKEGQQDWIIIPIWENEDFITTIDIEVNKSLNLPQNYFKGALNTHCVLPNPYENGNILIIGLGKETSYKNLQLIYRRITAKHIKNQTFSIVFPQQTSESHLTAAVTGLQMGAYTIGLLQKTPVENLSNGYLIIDNKLESTFEKATKIAAAQLETMKLVDLPANIVTPIYLANWVKEKQTSFNWDVQIFNRAQSIEKGLSAFCAVGQGSVTEPQFIIIQYKNGANTAPHIGLVGKSVTFDTGGLDIKTAGMQFMKSDMGGGAAVLGAMQAISDLELPINVTAILPCTENSVDGASYRPSDVIGSYSGYSIEIANTDAEGRLTLADGVSFINQNYKPDYIIDLATLTGSAVMTFGYEAGALFTQNAELQQALIDAGNISGEKLWPLPLWDDYDYLIKSDIADIKNLYVKPTAGAIAAAKFIEYFTEKHTAWAHLDIAGVAFGDNEFAHSKYATAYGVHLLTEFVISIIKN